MTHKGPGLPEAMRAHFARQHFQRHQLRLVVDNTCLLRPKRDHSRGIAGVRAIYGHDDGGPDDAA